MVATAASTSLWVILSIAEITRKTKRIPMSGTRGNGPASQT